MTPLERLVREHVDKRTTWNAMTEQLAEDIARDILADDAFRARVKALIQARLGPGSGWLDDERRQIRRQRLAYGLLVLGGLAIVGAALIVILRAL